ncbi:hypothetical protein [Gemmobacter serpentinus]|uniref:hypothetical protein n=1 Tax=Gemmobacter serpentinus TaxID=2652247 RepID=UPI00124C1876|nr:hypothetical protein [Gemmobacter serpentinus]
MPPIPDMQLDPARLAVLDRIARQHRATTTGLNDRLHGLRDKSNDTLARLAHLEGRTVSDPHIYAAPQIAELRTEAAGLAAQISEAEAEVEASADAAASARINLRSALELAEAENLPIPVGIDMEDARRAR